MIDEIKLMLGETANNFTDEMIGLCLKWALAEVEAYTNRVPDYELEIVAQKIAIIKLNRIHTEGLASQAYSGVSESYIDGYPAEILTALNRKRKIKVV